ncbi:MAG: hypothetical protein M9962_00170 [Oligoflexia bacterium]|nr:hypothetical protein [Oligoflexia bacterium]
MQKYLNYSILCIFSWFILFHDFAYAKGKTQALWTASLSGTSADDQFSSSKLVALYAGIQVLHFLHPKFFAKFEAGAVLEAGSSSSLFTNEFEPNNRLSLREASLNWRVFQPLTVRAGALPQSQHRSPLFIDGFSFPASQIILETRKNYFLLHTNSQMAIPTSKSISTKSVGKEKTPTLFTQKFLAGYSKNKTGLFLRATYFQYKHLTKGTAQDSRYYGNSISGIGASSRFIYAYQGWEFGPEGSLNLGNQFQLKAGASFISNQKGPKGSNQGRYAFLEFSKAFNTTLLSIKAEHYRNEADSTPAFYTSSEFGHNNRQGYGGSLKLEFKNMGFNLELKARSSDRIIQNPFQRDRFQFYQLGLELPYASF